MLKRIKIRKSHSSRSPKRGCFLIAEPSCRDKYFSRSVILLIDDENDRHIGLVINKISNLSQVALPPMPMLSNMVLFQGGPVDNHLSYLHNVPRAEKSEKIGSNLYFGGSLKTIYAHIKAAPQKYHIKFIAGYSGWDKGQLNAEIKNEDWVVSEAKLNVFSSNDLWRDALRSLNDNYYATWLNFPFHPPEN